MQQLIDNKHVLLASASPRRKQLIDNLGISNEIVKIVCDETYPEILEPSLVAAFIAEKKSMAFTSVIHPGHILLTADTVVCIDGHLLGKPKSKDEALDMLGSMSGKYHLVYSSFCLRDENKFQNVTDVARVKMADIDQESLHYYVDNFKPYDKAGAYGIQEWLGMAMISEIKGSFFTIMGLPTHKLFESLRSW